MVVETVIGAFSLACSALSAAMHGINHRRIRTLEKHSKIQTFESTGFCIAAGCLIGSTALNEYRISKEIKEFKLDVNSQLQENNTRLSLLETRCASLQIDQVKNQNDVIKAKVDHMANAVDIAIMENNE